jgi:hypothetical protein
MLCILYMCFNQKQVVKFKWWFCKYHICPNFLGSSFCKFHPLSWTFLTFQHTEFSSIIELPKRSQAFYTSWHLKNLFKNWTPPVPWQLWHWLYYFQKCWNILFFNSKTQNFKGNLKILKNIFWDCIPKQNTTLFFNINYIIQIQKHQAQLFMFSILSYSNLNTDNNTGI